MKFTESTTKDISAEKINNLRRTVEWRTRDEEKWKEILNKSSFVYSVWIGDELVGFGRIVEDGIMCMIYDVNVHKDYQGKGIGKMIMNNLLNQTNDKGYSSVSLFADIKNKEFLIPFYKRFGFESVETGMRLEK